MSEHKLITGAAFAPSKRGGIFLSIKDESEEIHSFKLPEESIVAFIDSLKTCHEELISSK